MERICIREKGETTLLAITNMLKRVLNWSHWNFGKTNNRFDTWNVNGRKMYYIERLFANTLIRMRV